MAREPCPECGHPLPITDAHIVYVNRMRTFETAPRDPVVVVRRCGTCDGILEVRDTHTYLSNTQDT